MKLFEVIIKQKKHKGDKSPVKVRPVLIVEENQVAAKDKAKLYWGDEYHIGGRPNMIADFNPK